ncbi:MAG: cyanate transporter [Pseudomonas sp.]|uniref:cyanate transporter n=1 Tax=Pseudomonas sp. TaxID=306 RepID=UPI003D13CF0C
MVRATAPGDRWRLLGWVLLLIMLGLNLRPMLTSISPLLADIRNSTGLGFQAAALLTTLPVVCMGIVALCAALIDARLGEGRGIALGLLCIVLACAARGFIADGDLLLGSALLGGVGIALIQVLVPGLIKRRFSAHVALFMGLYSAALMGGGGLAALLSPHLASAAGHWQVGLWVWGLPALATLLVWLKMPWQAAHVRAPRQGLSRFVRNRRAWLLALYFGFSNCGYMTVVAWLPDYYQFLGWSRADSGALLALMTVFQVLAALSMPAIAQRGRERRVLLSVSLIMQVVGFAGLLWYPQAAPLLWVALIGFGLGACFALCLILTLDHLPDPRAAGQLAAFVQGIGFLINAVAPSASGWLREQTGGFHATWVLMLLCILMMLAVTWRFSPASYWRITGNDSAATR